jgi:hypothetical protein
VIPHKKQLFRGRRRIVKSWHRFYDPETGRYISADPKVCECEEENEEWTIDETLYLPQLHVKIPVPLWSLPWGWIYSTSEAARKATKYYNSELGKMARDPDIWCKTSDFIRRVVSQFF